MVSYLYFMVQPGTLPLMMDTSDSSTSLVDTPAVPRRSRPKRRATRFLLILVASLLAGNALIGERGLIAIVRSSRDLHRLSQTITALKAENTGLRQEVHQLSEEPRAIEAVARRELGLIRPGERLFIVKAVPDANSPLRDIP
jgi:cell division protein FtsB